MPFQPARNVDETYAAVNPDTPLEPEDPRYVELSQVRGGEHIASIIASCIRRTPALVYHKQLVTGHGGCGKSTELKRLQGQLERDGYFVVYLDVEQELDLGDLEYLDVLVTMARGLDEQARRVGIRLSPQLLENIGRWFAETVLTAEQRRDVDLTLQTEYGVGLDVRVPLLARITTAITSQIRSGSSARTEIRRELERRLPVLINRLNDLIEEARQRLIQAGRKDLVIIVDGLEKVHYRPLPDGQSTHTLLFVEHAEQLKAPLCHLIYTVPISLLFNVNLGGAFAETEVIPMVKLTESDGRTLCPAGWQAFRQVLAQRVDLPAVFQDDATLDRLIEVSGGHVRDLLRLVRFACTYTDTRITRTEAERAVQKLVRFYDRLVYDDDLDRLTEIQQTRRVSGDRDSLLLYRQLVLEYQNDERWADVHPAVRLTRRFRDHLGVTS